jgi:hypothetical protein
MLNLHWRKGAGKGANFSTKLSVSKGSEGRERADKKPLPEAGQVVDHRADHLSQRAAFKIELPLLTGGGADQNGTAEQ